VVGNPGTVTGKVNGSEPGTCHGTDSTYSTGKAGMWGYGGLDGYFLDNWTAYNTSGAPAAARRCNDLLGFLRCGH
jgi:hypothetical protein